jgi:glycosyltransferase involved in cell wall biosynthesis
MRLLVITQKVDLADPVLGFFHSWLGEFAKRSERLVVICLEQGMSHLPPSVTVRSLGKEKGRVSRLHYLFRFYRLLWQERKSYDAVFVHMNQEYLLAAGVWWKMRGKKVFLWRNHARGSWLTAAAVSLADKVFFTSPDSYTARFPKAELMPVGIATDFFCPDPRQAKRPRSLLFLGRISPVKRVELFLAVLEELAKRKVDFSATIAGVVLPADRAYADVVKAQVAARGLGSHVRFLGSVSPEEALRLYREHELYVNLTPAGSMDKTIFEALAVGTAVVATNPALASILGEGYVGKLPPLAMARKVERMFGHGHSRREFVVAEHSLNRLATLLFHHYG